MEELIIKVWNIRNIKPYTYTASFAFYTVNKIGLLCDKRLRALIYEQGNIEREFFF